MTHTPANAFLILIGLFLGLSTSRIGITAQKKADCAPARKEVISIRCWPWVSFITQFCYIVLPLVIRLERLIAWARAFTVITNIIPESGHTFRTVTGGALRCARCLKQNY